MHRMTTCGLLWVLLSFGLMSGMGKAMAEDIKPQHKSASEASTSSKQDILADNADDEDAADAANDFDSNKEDQSEEAAPTPQEEEDNPLLDEEGNVIKQGQELSKTLMPQTPVSQQMSQAPTSEQNPFDMLNQNVSTNTTAAHQGG